MPTRAPAVFLGVQVRTGPSYFREPSEGGWVYRDDLEHLNYWLRHVLPVIVVLYDEDAKVAYWQSVQEDRIERTGKGWKMVVPRDQVLSEDCRDQLFALTDVPEPLPEISGMFSGLLPFMRMADVLSRLSEIAKRHPTADGVFTIQVLRVDKEGANFWVYSHGRDGPGGGRRHEGTWEELEEIGFDYEIVGDGADAMVTLSFDRYFANTPIPHEVIDGPQVTVTVGRGENSPCYFLRRVNEGGGEAVAEGDPAGS